MTSSAPNSQNVSIHTQAWLMLMCGLVYFYAFQLNMHWFSDWLEFSPGVNWIFIPSGLRLLFVLVLVGTGATGIVLGSIAINYLLGDPEAHLFNMVTAIISGTAPYLARYLSITWLRLDAHLANLSGNTLFKVSVLFAIINALTHQVWFYLTGRTENLIGSFTAMAVGDWFGTVLVLATAGLGIKLFKLHRSSVL
jgi:hypothetical protein